MILKAFSQQNDSIILCQQAPVFPPLSSPFSPTMTTKKKLAAYLHVLLFFFSFSQQIMGRLQLRLFREFPEPRDSLLVLQLLPSRSPNQIQLQSAITGSFCHVVSYLKFSFVSFPFSVHPVFTEHRRTVLFKMSCRTPPASSCQARWEQLSPRSWVISAMLV